MEMFFWLSQNEKNKNPKKHKNEYKLSKIDVYCSKLSQDIVNTDMRQMNLRAQLEQSIVLLYCY